jgi:UDP-N-acetylmuramoyl-L-alanyl-D-glutamate--2,6-diaminopimelate ligase
VPDAWPRPTTTPVALDDVFAGLGAETVPPQVRVAGITHDSRDVRAGDLYCAPAGRNVHGAEFSAQARERGAAAILTDESGRLLATASGLPVVVVPDVRAVMGTAAARVYGHPADDLLMLGVTGTNGKTTTAYMLEAILSSEGRSTGLIGTIETRIGDTVMPSVRTTPESTAVHALLAVMRERGVGAVVMEVSSHALVMGRVDGIVFDVVGFTNLSRDHLDFHGTMEAYFAAKASLFTPSRARRAAICVDDAWGARLLTEATVPVTAVGTGAHASFVERNAALAAAMAGLVGADPIAAEAVARTVSVPGRWERPLDQHAPFLAVVDYAHTPDAVAAAVSAAVQAGPAPVIVVMGAGGDRDADKRPLMGAAASLADVVIVTDDNPRSEVPAAIRSSVLDGLRAAQGDAQVLEIGDRRAAIDRGVVEAAAARGTLLVLGKGHEQGQEIAGVMHPFDDRDEVRAAWSRLGRAR